MNVPAPESSPALNTKRGTTGMNQPFIAQLEGQVLSRCREPWLQCSRCEPGLLSGPFFWLVSCTALQPKSCFLHRNVKNTKQAVQSLCFGHNLPAATRVWWRRDGEQHREDTSSAHHHFSLGIREGPISPRGTASQSSATGIEASWGWAPLWPHTNTPHPAAKKRAGRSVGYGVTTPSGNFCTLERVPSLEGNGTVPILPPVFTQRRRRSCYFLLSKTGTTAGDIAWAWAKHVGMRAATPHACPGELCQLTSSPDLT